MALDYRVAFKAIHKILINDWDPLGVNLEPGAHGEYDSYIPTIYRMIVQGVSEDTMEDYLDSVAYESLGLPSNNDLDLRTISVARKLLDELAWLTKLDDGPPDDSKRNM